MAKSNRTRPILSVILVFSVLTAGIGAFIYVIYSGISDLGDSLIRVSVPGPSEVMLVDPGDYTVFLENPAPTAEQVTGGTSLIAGLGINLESPLGQPVPVEPAGPGSTYSIGGRRGVSVFAFKVRTPGRYRLTVVYDREKGPPPVLTLSQGFSTRLIRLVLVGIGLLGTTFALSALMVILGFFKRSSAASRFQP